MNVNADIPVKRTRIKKEPESSEKVLKKRGRKPKGGKILQVNSCDENVVLAIPNIIIHLKCVKEDLKTNDLLSESYEPCNLENIDTYQFQTKEVEYEKVYEIHSEDSMEDYDNVNHKLLTLSHDLHTNNISDKRSCCFWCTCDFDNPLIYVPKYAIDSTYHVYGCFCSPECAAGFLFNQSDIDPSAKFERYALLNHIYCKIYNYEKNIKPAPDPRYTLDKFYGNLSIQEYRQLLKNERLLLIVDKPLIRSLPELHIDNDDFVINNRNASGKFKLKTVKKRQTKTEILSNNFNLK
jgi:hypothetical protein